MLHLQIVVVYIYDVLSCLLANHYFSAFTIIRSFFADTWRANLNCERFMVVADGAMQISLSLSLLQASCDISISAMTS